VFVWTAKLDASAIIETFGVHLLQGLGITLQVFGGAAVVATALGLIFGIARLSKRKVIRYPAIGFVEFFRGTAALVQLFWIFYALPLLLGFPIPPLWAAWVIIGCNQGAYLAEVVRGAILAVPTNQIEAAVAINLNPRTRWRRIIVPQAIPIIIPTYTNHIITVLKETAIVSLIGIHDLTHTANVLRTQFGGTTMVFISIACIYLAVALLIAWLGKRLEHRVDIYRIPRTRRKRLLPVEMDS